MSECPFYTAIERGSVCSERKHCSGTGFSLSCNADPDAPLACHHYRDATHRQEHQALLDKAARAEALVIENARLKCEMGKRGWVDGEEYPFQHYECSHYTEGDCQLAAEGGALEGMEGHCDCDLDDHRLCYRPLTAEVERLTEALRLAKEALRKANEDGERLAAGLTSCRDYLAALARSGMVAGHEMQIPCYEVTDALAAHETRKEAEDG